MKRIAVFMTLALVLLAMPLTAFAEPVETYAASMPDTPNYNYVSNIYTYIDQYGDGSTVKCVSTVTGVSNVSKITITQTLQKEGFLWIYYTYDDDSEWKLISYSNATSFVNDKSGLTSGKYRLKTTVTLKTLSGGSETFTVYSDPITV